MLMKTLETDNKIFYVHFHGEDTVLTAKFHTVGSLKYIKKTTLMPISEEDLDTYSKQIMPVFFNFIPIFP